MLDLKLLLFPYMIQQRVFLGALCIFAAGMATGCVQDAGTGAGSGDRSDDLAGRSLQIVSSNSVAVTAGEYSASMLLEERADRSVTIYSDSYVYSPLSADFEIAQATSWISFDTSLFGFVLSYRQAGSTGEWTTVSADGSLDNYTIFEHLTVRSSAEGPLLEGTAISFADIAFDDNGTSQSERFNTFHALHSGLPARFEIKIIPIPVWNFGDFESSYDLDFEINEI